MFTIKNFLKTKYLKVGLRFKYTINNPNFKVYNIESSYKNKEQCIDIRRDYYHKKYNIQFNHLSKKNFDYESILNKNCENVIGYATIPIGLVGPLLVNNNQHFIPISTTEGALVGSINRGAGLISKTSMDGINAITIDKGITRSPIIDVININNIPVLQSYINNNLDYLKKEFKKTTQYGELKNTRAASVIDRIRRASRACPQTGLTRGRRKVNPGFGLQPGLDVSPALAVGRASRTSHQGASTKAQQTAKRRKQNRRETDIALLSRRALAAGCIGVLRVLGLQLKFQTEAVRSVGRNQEIRTSLV